MELNDEQIRDVYRLIADEAARRYYILKENLQYVKQNIDYPFECIEEYLDCSNEHIGYVRVLRDEQYREFGYSQYDFYVLCPEDQNRFGNYLHFMRQDDNEENNFHCLIYQVCGCCEDDYSGYLLFPLNNGMYWMISFY